MFINDLFENNEDMFATPWRVNVAKLLQKMLDNPSIRRNYEIVPDDLEDIQRLISALQSNNIEAAKKLWGNFNYNELDNALYLYIHRLRPEIDLFKLLEINVDDYLEESDDMFASPFRVERDIMEWQEKAAENFEGYERPRGMQSVKDDDIIYLYVIQKDGKGRCTGVYYSPQPATEATNIGTYNLKFQGNFEEYLKQDPHNPFKQVNEEDDMFAPSKTSQIAQSLTKQIGFANGRATRLKDMEDRFGAERVFVASKHAEILPKLLSVLQRSGLTAAVNLWWREYYANAYSGQFAAAELAEEGLGLSSAVKQDTGVGFFELSKQLVTENQLSNDGMFAVSSSSVLNWYKKLDELCDETGNNADELMRFESDTWSHLYINAEDEGYPASVIAVANNQERQQIIQDIKGFIQDIQQESGITESSDMFSDKPNLAVKIGNAIQNLGYGYLNLADDLQGDDQAALEERANYLISAGNIFSTQGMVAGSRAWAKVDQDDRRSFYEYSIEIEGWNPEEFITMIKEDAAGVGVVSNSKDPRYVMATMGDQNDVTAETLPKMMKAYSLIGKKAKKK